MENTIDVPMRDVRDIKTITAEIITLTRQAQKMILNYAIEVGRRLCEAKSMLPHGQWGAYLAQEVEFSQSTANNFMKIFEEYGAEQMTLDGAVAKSQTLGNLTYSKALKLLAVPAEEREEFVKTHDVEAMSSRQLEQAIRERDEAKGSLLDAQREKKALQEDLQAATLAAARAAADFEKQQKEAKAELERKLAQAQKAELEAKKAASQAQKELERLQKQPVSEDAIARIKNEAKAEFEKEQASEQMKLKAMEEAAKSAQREAERAASEAEMLRKQLALASADATAFKVHFESLQEGYNKLHGTYLKIEAADPEQAAKLRRAILAVLESFRKRMEG